MGRVGRGQDFAFDLYGIEDMIKRLQKVGTKTARMAPSRAVRAGGKIILQEMKKNAPVRTGELKKKLSQVIRKYAKSKNTVGIVGAKYLKIDAKHKDPGVYVNFIEYESPSSQRPFMKKSWDTASYGAVQAIKREVTKTFREEALKQKKS